jgi:perosamine synthetase
LLAAVPHKGAAEQHGQAYKMRASKLPNKQITTGEGGLVLTNDKALADHCRNLRNLCSDKAIVHPQSSVC